MTGKDQIPGIAETDPKKESELQTDITEAQSDATIAAFLDAVGEIPTVLHGSLDEPVPEGHKSGFISVIGRPNVGKSTLVNALVGQKISIVSRKPQTTRTLVTGISTTPAYQMIFIDTPGIHMRHGHKLNKRMVDTAVAAIPDADVILFVVDVLAPPHQEDKIIARLLSEKTSSSPVLFVMNKMDRLSLERAQERIEAYWALLPDYTDSLPTSALKGTNIIVLREKILAYLPEGPRYYPGDQITDQTEYTIAAELVREAMLTYTHQEVPHASAVLVEDYNVRDNGVVYIAATIWVERESQKPIVIGKEGKLLKMIGSAARKELERFVGSKVYLELWVKVQPDWRNRDNRLRELGY
ncbi:MAG: GTPase Era [Anaerolineae bacterium]|nr:GTPase Era [Anaerolineae bacterium]